MRSSKRVEPVLPVRTKCFYCSWQFVDFGPQVHPALRLLAADDEAVVVDDVGVDGDVVEGVDGREGVDERGG